MTTNITTAEDRQEIGADLRSEEVRETRMVNGENIRIDGGAHAGAKW